MVYHPLSRLVPLFIQQRYDTNPAVRSTCSQKIYLLCLSGVEGLLGPAQKPLNDHVTNLQLRNDDPSGASPPAGSAGGMTPHEGYFLLSCKAEMRHTPLKQGFGIRAGRPTCPVNPHINTLTSSCRPDDPWRGRTGGRPKGSQKRLRRKLRWQRSSTKILAELVM